jgi:hypothetical protein
MDITALESSWRRFDSLPPRRNIKSMALLAGATLFAGAFDQETSFIASVRHERLLAESGDYLEKARGAVEDGIPHEMLLLDLYAALRPIDASPGRPRRTIF